MKCVLNIITGKVHNADCPCQFVRRTKEQNKKYFDNLEDAINYFEGGKRKGEQCGACKWND